MLNMPWAMMDQDLLEYESLQIILDVIMKAEIKRRWPEEKLAVGRRVLSRWRRTRAAKVTEGLGWVW
jgi:hypothetical protein